MQVYMRLKDIPWFNRPWTKIRRKGISELDDAELLATIFIRGRKGINAIDLSNKLLARYNFNEFSKCTISELNDVLKDEIKTYQILSLSELFIRYSKLEKRGFKQYIDESKDVFNMFVDEFKHKRKEYLYGLIVDKRNRITKRILISKGTLDVSLIHPREVFKPAIKESGHSIILVHNHPSGDCEPSNHDIMVTQKIRKSGELLGIPLQDHIIIGKDNYYSFKDEKRLN